MCHLTAERKKTNQSTLHFSGMLSSVIVRRQQVRSGKVYRPKKLQRTACLIGTIGAAGAEPLDWLNKDQKVAVGQLIGGYTESIICKKQIDLANAGKFLQQKLGDEKFSADQLAQLFHMVVGVRAMQMGEFLKSRPSEQSVTAHCKTVYDNAFGPKGSVIPGLLN